VPTDLDLLLFLQDQVLTRAQALRHVSEGALRHAIGSGRWQVPHLGIYVAHNGPVTDNQRRWVAVLASRGHIAGVSALSLLGLRGFATPHLHLLVPGHRRDDDPPPLVRIHRTSALPHSERGMVNNLPCNGARPGSGRRGAVGVDGRAGRVDRGREFPAAAGDCDGRSDDARPNAARPPGGLVSALLEDLAGGVGSLPEAQFLRICRKAGFPRPKLQVSRRDASGRRRYLDAYFEEYAVHVEVDGGQHREIVAWWAEMKRQNDLWIVGDRVLRFPSWAVRSRPEEVAAQVRAALRAAGWPG